MEMSPKSIYSRQISDQIAKGAQTFEVMIEFYDSNERERDNLINDFLKVTNNVVFGATDTMRVDNSRYTRRYVFCDISKETLFAIVKFYKDSISKVWNDNDISAMGGAC